MKTDTAATSPVDMQVTGFSGGDDYGRRVPLSSLIQPFVSQFHNLKVDLGIIWFPNGLIRISIFTVCNLIYRVRKYTIKENNHRKFLQNINIYRITSLQGFS